jgi:hypothetical protein
VGDETAMKRLVAFVALWSIVAAACTSSNEPPSSPSRTVSPVPSVDVKTGTTTAAQAMKRLCISADVEAGPVTKVPTPPAIAEVEDEVASVRDLPWERRVNVEPIDDREMDRRLAKYFEMYYPEEFYDRRSLAWQTIGALPPDVGYLEALDAYQQGQVLGFYNSQNEELVYAGDTDISRIEQFILAHELTHAIDDQHFDLDRLDDMAIACQDELGEAAVGVVEGSANHFATQVILRYPNPEMGDLPDSGDPGNVPPMITELQNYPYTDGQRFVDALADQGGVAAVNRALRTFPTTTEQILHPDKYPDDQPQDVDVPDFAPTFGEDWQDLDVMVVGELWLKILLGLRRGDAEGAAAAAAWDGGIYRAWSDGDDVAVALVTKWDSPSEASAFASALRGWVRDGDGHGVVLDADGDQVVAGFASNEDLLGPLAAALRTI